MADIDPLYVAARHVLLDALQALAPHRDAVIVVGAQAVYLHTGDADLAVAPYTTDGDVAIDPQNLGPEPDIAQAMQDAGFAQRSDNPNPGQWAARTAAGARHVDIPVDLIVPDAVAPGRGRRSVALPGHDHLATRRVQGLEAVLIDNDWKRIAALDAGDVREVDARVAGPVALLIAKTHKINDRLAPDTSRHRQDDKDALDVYRLMQTTAVDALHRTVPQLFADDRSAASAARGFEALDTLFGRRRAPGIEMAVRALEGSVPDARVQAVCKAFMDQLREVLERS